MVDDSTAANDELSMPMLLSYDNDRLLEELGRDLLGSGKGIGPGAASRFRRIAAEWLDQHADQLRQQVCGNSTIEAITDSGTADRMADLAVIADAISGILGHPSAFIVAVILMRRGLSAFCRGESPV